MAQRQLSSTTTTMTATMTQGFAPPPPPVQKAPSTDAFIQNLNLVAEAAKRAQMAVLMRDLEGIAISYTTGIGEDLSRTSKLGSFITALCTTLCYFADLAPDIGIFGGHGYNDVGRFFFSPRLPPPTPTVATTQREACVTNSNSNSNSIGITRKLLRDARHHDHDLFYIYEIKG
ncbi:hypothetical protein F4813DRAFT_389835 [Daldinia decipiens]|uniref:uncharacterized protein n=1 Tax=Daldinia decipiens TaxID=326647 RepID=UPI0020C46C5F|nr:uncharacterized protein F4813DRAFT_389835 [Daldinia decipiens]KAI1657250.1 hypothetical protein F4813DRAFT_389835 [Daldinia decipiens]